MRSNLLPFNYTKHYMLCGISDESDTHNTERIHLQDHKVVTIPLHQMIL